MSGHRLLVPRAQAWELLVIRRSCASLLSDKNDDDVGKETSTEICLW